MNRRIAMGGAVALGLSVLLVAPAAHAEETGTTPTATGTIYYKSGFDARLSDTRATGHIKVVGTALHIWTETATKTDKVAEYVDTDTPLAATVGAVSLDYTTTSGGAPGYQLVVDFDHDGTADGILVGETIYGDDWWLSDGSAQTVKDAAPEKGGSGFGGYYHGTLAEWNTVFHGAVVKAFGFSLGSYVQGDGLLNSITFAGTTYTFAEDVILTSKDECKGGGWATSTVPVYKNQGECVSHFATATNNGSRSGSAVANPVATPATTGTTVSAGTAAGASPVVARTGTGGTTKKI